MASLTALFPDNGTIKSTSIEGAVLEVAQLIQNYQDANPTVTARLALNYASNLANIVISLPIFIANVNGQVNISSQDNYPAMPFVRGTGSDLQSNRPDASLLEMLANLQAREITNPTPVDEISIAYNTETSRAEITANILCTFEVNPTTGKVEVTPRAYLG